MAKIKVKGDVNGVVENKGISVVQVGDRDKGAAVRAALVDLLQVVDADSKLPTEQSTRMREQADKLQAATKGPPSRWKREKLHALLADLTLLAAGTVATTGAVDAVRESLEPLIR